MDQSQMTFDVLADRCRMIDINQLIRASENKLQDFCERWYNEKDREILRRNRELYEGTSQFLYHEPTAYPAGKKRICHDQFKRLDDRCRSLRRLRDNLIEMVWGYEEMFSEGYTVMPIAVRKNDE